jgi:hypothetical protein
MCNNVTYLKYLTRHKFLSIDNFVILILITFINFTINFWPTSFLTFSFPVFIISTLFRLLLLLSAVSLNPSFAHLFCRLWGAVANQMVPHIFQGAVANQVVLHIFQGAVANQIVPHIFLKK